MHNVLNDFYKNFLIKFYNIIIIEILIDKIYIL